MVGGGSRWGGPWTSVALEAGLPAGRGCQPTRGSAHCKHDMRVEPESQGPGRAVWIPGAGQSRVASLPGARCGCRPPRSGRRPRTGRRPRRSETDAGPKEVTMPAVVIDARPIASVHSGLNPYLFSVTYFLYTAILFPSILNLTFPVLSSLLSTFERSLNLLTVP